MHESVAKRPGLRLTSRAVLFLPRQIYRPIHARRNLMKIIVTALKPRNPLIAHAQFRRAGSHRPGGRSMRQQGGRALQRELVHMKQHSP
jgi:hypothetical protein